MARRSDKGAVLTFDHIAIATTDLARGTAEVEAALGVPLAPGGRHDRFGTHNSLLHLGDLYLEVIAADPENPVPRPRWFGLDDFTGRTRPANWIARTDDLAALRDVAPDLGDIHDLARGALHWQMIVPGDGSLPMRGGWPTPMRWGPVATHPVRALPDRGCRLIAWNIAHPEAETLRRTVPVKDSRVTFSVADDVDFTARIATPGGEVTLA